MSNETEKNENTQMAFPLISSIQEFNLDTVDIEVAGRQVEFQVFLGDIVDYKNEDNEENMKFDFNSIAKSISNSEYSPKNYNLDDMGRLYKYNVVSNNETGVNIAIMHSNDENKSKIMAKGFNGYQSLDGFESFVSRNIYEKELEIFIIGEEVDLKFKAYSDVELENETNVYSSLLEEDEISMRDYIGDQIEIFKNQVKYLDHIADNQIFNLFAKQLDENFEMQGENLDMEFLFSLDRMDMFLVLIYDVDFPPYSTKDISINYKSTGAMNSRESMKPIYTFAYILNPAKNWKSFKNLNVEIKPPPSNPYIIDSSLKLTRKENGNYIGNFESLPAEDLFFSLYYKEGLTIGDKMKGFLRKNSYITNLLLLSLLGIFIGFIIRKSYNRLRKIN